MTPAFTILLPHKLNSRNNDALTICIDCLSRNTMADFALLMSAADDQPLYATMNRLVQEAPTDTCVFMHSDMFVSAGWDRAMWEVYSAFDPIFVTGLLVEPGAIGVYAGNVTKDFGRRPEAFRRAEFEAWSESNDAPQAAGEGWFAPYMFSRRRFLDLGGHDLDAPEGVVWTSLDVALFKLHKERGGRVQQARSIVYHLQRWSDTEEQEAEKRL